MLNLSDAVNILQNGDVIAYPTEAVYGLGCDPLNESAVLKLLALKHRAVEKGLILIASDIAQLTPYIDTKTISPERLTEIYATWPGPFTWVFPASEKTLNWIRGKHSSVAVRVTAHPVASALCAAYGGAIVSTSANVEAQPPACTAKQVREIFREIYVVEGEVGGLERPTEIRDAMSGKQVRK